VLNQSQQAIDFSDLENLSDLEQTAKQQQAVSYVPCIKCGGRGEVVIGYVHIRYAKCFNCKGTGKVRSDYEKRKAAYKKGLETQRKNLGEKIIKFMDEYKSEMEWMVRSADRGFDFAKSLLNSLNQYGSLTERQLAAVRKCMQSEIVRAEERKQTQERRDVQLNDNAGLILKALQKAYDSRIANPKLRTAEAVFSLAKPNSKNPDCVYVTAPSRQYLGKITPDGIFKPVRDCSAEQKLAIMKIAKDPLEAATLHGKEYGVCSCCGRRLDNRESIELGIGPICRSKYF
jgi:hypothetical protein